MSEALRKAAEQALEALEDLRKFGIKQSTALFALRAALAKPDSLNPAQTGIVTEERDGGLPWTVKCSDGKTRLLYPSETGALSPCNTNRTTPKLTEEEIDGLAEEDGFLLYVSQYAFQEIARHIEAAVRKQFGVEE